MLMGEYKHTVDTKGRVIIPMKLREELGEKFIVTRGLDGCLFGYPMSSWQSLTEKLSANLPLSQKNARQVVRFFYSAATEVEFDKQGRVMIPQTLREYAAIKKNVRIVGVSDRLEIWDDSTWKEYVAQTQNTVDELTEEIEFEF